MPEISVDLPAPACFYLHSEGGIEENQTLNPDLFSQRAGARDRRGRFAEGHSGNPKGRPRGIPNPKRRAIGLQAWRANPEAARAVAKRRPWLLRPLIREVFPPAPPVDPAERIGLRIEAVRTPEQVWRALDKVMQAASRGEIAPADTLRIMRRIDARLRLQRRCNRIMQRAAAK
jgi:uncharacterized protein DUF5681